MKQITILVISFFLLLFSEPIYGQNTEPNWKAGVAKVKITPEHDMWLAGFAARTKPSDGIMHDLWAKALFLEDAAGNQALFITTDLLGFPKAISDQVRDRLQSELGLSRAQIILNSSHTHSGPVLKDALKDIYPLDKTQKECIEKYSLSLAEKIFDLAEKAKRSMKPADIYAENGVVRFQVNRRNNPKSKIAELTELKGPNDYAVPVLKIENKRGKTKAVVFGYACHPVVLNGYQWSGDYSGFAQLELEKKYKGATAMFFQGAGADQNPMPRGSVLLAKQYGQELAAAVERVLSEKMRKLQPNITTAYTEVDLELNDPPTKEKLIQLKNELEGWQKTWAENMLGKLNAGTPLLTSYPFPVQVWKVGDQNIVSLGGELLVNYSNNLKKILGNDLFVLGYSNDVMGYIPGERVLAEGGYEGETSQMVYGLPATWKTGIEKNIVEQTVELAEEVGISLNDESKKALDKMFEKNVTEDSHDKKQLTAKTYFSGFDLAHDTYNAISSASDGKIYYVLSSQEIDVGGQVYVYDPATDQTRWLADLTEICGEKDMKAISQGKSHVRFIESDGKLYFGTHVGFYEMIDGMERLPVNAPDGYKLYPGGHFLSYDISENTFEDLAIAPHGEGILTMTMDTERKQIYAITWPKGYFIHYDLVNNTLNNLGLVSENGEAGQVGDDYRVICRSMFVDSRDGKAYYSTAEGDIFSYNPAEEAMEKVKGVDLRLDYFGRYDYTGPGSMAYNWRTIVWEPNENVAYGVHGNSGYLFRFDPKEPKIEIVERITSVPSQRSGMFDQFSYGYLGFDLDPNKETLYYLTGGPIYIDGRRVKGVDEIAMGAARGLENLHLITYNIPTNTYTDHGPVFYDNGTRPTYVNSIAIDKDGNVYTLARFEHDGKLIQDLVKIPNPFENE